MALTLATLLELKLLAAWPSSDGRMPVRSFYYSKHWADVLRTMRGPEPRRRINWSENSGFPMSPPAPPDDNLPDIDLAAHDPSPRGRLERLVETFVIGWPATRLVRPRGFGMDPPFKRMRPPRSAVVEMRTAQTRTFGFFARKDVFVAHRLALADETHADETRYAVYGDEVLKLLDRISATDKDATTPIEALIGDTPSHV